MEITPPQLRVLKLAAACDSNFDLTPAYALERRGLVTIMVRRFSNGKPSPWRSVTLTDEGWKVLDRVAPLGVE